MLPFWGRENVSSHWKVKFKAIYFIEDEFKRIYFIEVEVFDEFQTNYLIEVESVEAIIAFFGHLVLFRKQFRS